MEFNEKLQELRKQKGLTQEELAESLYVSRTAISKWESGKGYPNIDSLKAIAKFFSVTIDELLSSNEVLTIAEEDNNRKQTYYCDLVCGLLDISMIMLLFLPFFAQRSGGVVLETSLLALSEGSIWLKYVYLAVVVGTALVGVLRLAVQGCQAMLWTKWKTKLSMGFSVLTVLVFAMSLQPYAAVLSFVLLIIKGFMLIKR